MGWMEHYKFLASSWVPNHYILSFIVSLVFDRYAQPIPFMTSPKCSKPTTFLCFLSEQEVIDGVLGYNTKIIIRTHKYKSINWEMLQEKRQRRDGQD